MGDQVARYRGDARLLRQDHRGAGRSDRARVQRRSVHRNARRLVQAVRAPSSSSGTASISLTYRHSFTSCSADPEIGETVAARFKYVLVDEYQDTNYVQEQLLTKLASATRNICVVGDEDQSLYRFRGATVRNILEFPRTFPDAKQVKLTINYRSHERIVEAYDRWMASADWSNATGPPFRFPKTIEPDPDAEFPDYPAVFCIWGTSAADEAATIR